MPNVNMLHILCILNLSWNWVISSQNSLEKDTDFFPSPFLHVFPSRATSFKGSLGAENYFCILGY